MSPFAGCLDLRKPGDADTQITVHLEPSGLDVQLSLVVGSSHASRISSAVKVPPN